MFVEADRDQVADLIGTWSIDGTEECLTLARMLVWLICLISVTSNAWFKRLFFRLTLSLIDLTLFWRGPITLASMVVTWRGKADWSPPSGVYISSSICTWAFTAILIASRSSIFKNDSAELKSISTKSSVDISGTYIKYINKNIYPQTKWRVHTVHHV